MSNQQKHHGPIRYSVAFLLILTLAVACFFGGLLTGNAIEHLEATGRCTIVFPRGATRGVEIIHVGGDEYRLEGAGVLNGVYERDGNQMIVIEPNDTRMTGLVWTRMERGWRLTSETPGTPTGSSYVGAELTPKP